MRLIDADTAFGVLADYYHHSMPIQYMALKEALDRVPTVEAVQERKGRWVELYDSNYKCSECGAWWHSDDMDINEEFRFCPSCGAHMEGVEDAEKEN